MSFGPIFIERPVLSVEPILFMASQLGITVQKPQDLHVTVMYSRTAVSWCHPVFLPDPSLLWLQPQAFVFDRFGPDNSILVLKIDSRELQERHRQLCAAGARWDFETYQPHITLGAPPDHALPGSVAFPTRLTLGAEVRRDIVV